MGRSTLTRIAGPGPLRRLLAVAAVALATANCSTSPQKLAAAGGNGVDPKYGVKASPRLYNEGDVIPKGGGRRFSGKPYVVAGQTYVPREDARGYVREGLASWYGAAFHGRMTANGEVFDRLSIAAAHPTLPLPSYARVTNLQNGYSMVVRVNDRGPYHAGRVMDVSEEVARALEFHRKGTERVRVEYVGKASVAGSDDRKLLASLRTDGTPAGVRSAVMVADLGPSEESERYAKPARPALAFKPESDAEAVGEPPAPPSMRRPVVIGATVKVPAALQPTVKTPGIVRTAGIGDVRRGVALADGRTGRNAGPHGPGTPSPTPSPIRLAESAAQSAPRGRDPTAGGMPTAEKLAMARLASAATIPAGRARPSAAKDRLAGIY